MGIPKAKHNLRTDIFHDLGRERTCGFPLSCHAKVRQALCSENDAYAEPACGAEYARKMRPCHGPELVEGHEIERVTLGSAKDRTCGGESRNEKTADVACCLGQGSGIKVHQHDVLVLHGNTQIERCPTSRGSQCWETGQSSCEHFELTRVVPSHLLRADS
jgi:hypothetical protein